MFCENCGSVLNEGSNVCSNCGAHVKGNPIRENKPTEVKTTGILVFSIIELLFCNFLFGLISFILYFVKLKPAVDNGDVEGTRKSKKTITILLIVGFVLQLMLSLLLFLLIAIPNFNGIQNRMEVRADMSTASQVGKAVRVWYTEVTTDSVMAARIDTEAFENGFVRVDELEEIENYCGDYEPTSYGENGEYYVTITSNDASGRIVVAIGPDNLYSVSGDSGVYETFYRDIDENVEVTYAGGASGIAYVEPIY